jgi:2-polyprenyl-6-methoxyphenol hydroxylase-like FAD-dependent oxidoreductase
VKPYFGLGVNSAIEDVTVLDDCLTYAASGERGGWTRALPEFSRRRAPDAKVRLQGKALCQPDQASAGCSALEETRG